ncbi:MAG: type IV pilus twitching motility protein PilT [Planctomycetota bacterium]|jgi:twitching motility protein PilT
MEKLQLEELLDSLVQSGGSTLHLMAGRAPCLRIEGNLEVADQDRLTAADITELTKDFLFADHRERLERGEEVEVLYSSTSDVRFRTTVIPQSRGLSLVFRRVPHDIPRLEDLGLPALFDDFANLGCGLFLLTGFFGSGKSTAMAALIDRINEQNPVQIVTLEDPIEFIHEQKNGFLHQRELGSHVTGVVEGIRDAYRQSAQVIYVSELDSRETLLAVLEAVERGCLVLAAMHASSVVGALSKLLGAGEDEVDGRLRERFAKCLRVMVSQALLRQSRGPGRVPLLEIMIKNHAVDEAIAAGKYEELPAIMARSKGMGMQTTDMALRQLVDKNLISSEEALFHAADREWVRSGSSNSPI